MKHLWIWLVVVSALTACTQQQSYIEPVRERESVVRETLLGMIQDGEPARAVAKAHRYQREGLFSTEEATALTSKAASQLLSRVEEAVADEDYLAAIAATRSLMTLEEPIPDDIPSLSTLFLRHADQLLEDGNRTAALSVLLMGRHWESLDTATLQRYADVSLEASNRYAAGQITRVLSQRGVDIPSAVAEFVSADPSFADMLSGAATIWVNRGIRLESGMGLPDRVIGSGFFIDSRGYLITNYHVIASEVDPSYEGYSRLYIKLPGNPDQKIPARVVGYDRIFDIALLKVEVDPAYVFSFTNVRELSPGSTIYAIGSPGGLENSISSGIISAVGRRFLQMGDALQVDVPINPGNSGGPLLDAGGDLIGVVFSGIEFFEGVNFAIPSHWIQYSLAHLYQGGEVAHPWIGLTTHRDRDGLLVGYVYPGSPAAEAGIRPGDVLRAVAEWTGNTIGDAQDELLQYQPGELITAVWQRRGEDGTEEFRGYLSLGERPFSPVKSALAVEEYYDLLPALFGMRVTATGGFFRPREFVVEEVLPGSVADETGLSAGDPFSVRGWDVDYEHRAAFLRIVVRKRKAGFMETAIQLASYLEVDNFL